MVVFRSQSSLLEERRKLRRKRRMSTVATGRTPEPSDLLESQPAPARERACFPGPTGDYLEPLRTGQCSSQAHNLFFFQKPKRPLLKIILEKRYLRTLISLMKAEGAPLLWHLFPRLRAHASYHRNRNPAASSLHGASGVVASVRS